MENLVYLDQMTNYKVVINQLILLGKYTQEVIAISLSGSLLNIKMLKVN